MGEETARATRSLSICAPSASMEALAEAAPRRRPAARSQSARLTGARSVRRRPPPPLDREQRARFSSEPRLAEAETPPAVRRQASARRRPPAHNPAHRKSAAFLDVPRAPPPQDEEPDEDSYRLRTFNVNHKGGIVNRGDSFRRRRSRSGSLAPAAEPPPEPRRPPAHRVAVLGAPGVGKTAIISQFQTSECINAYDGQRGDTDEQKVSVMLNGEESDMVFINVANYKEEVECADPPPDAFMVVYSVVDKASFQRAEQELARLTDLELLRPRPALLVANKIDLARSRAVSTQDGKCLACTYKAKFIEVSVGINHNVDELLVGTLNQIRLKKELFGSEDSTRESSPAHWYKSRGVVRASMKARQMLTWIFGKEDSKFKNCENLHVL